MVNWKEIARDILALGSIPFYFIVIVRAIVGDYAPFIYQLVFALLALFLLCEMNKKANQHIARGLILAVFTSLFYKDTIYTVFAFALLIAMIFSLHYLKTDKKEILNGLIFGAISSAVSYYATSFIT